MVRARQGLRLGAAVLEGGSEAVRRHAPPAGPILALCTADLDDKDALLATGAKGFFTIPHFEGYAAVLVQLRTAAKKPLREAIEDAWLACAPEALVRRYLDGS